MPAMNSGDQRRIRSRRALTFAPLLLVTLVHGGDRAGDHITQNEEEAAGITLAPPEAGKGPGIWHTLRRGQTLYSLSRAYGVPLDLLAKVNEIRDPGRIQAGRVLFIPGASHPLDIPPTAARLLAWPINGRVTSPFEANGRRARHEGIDIDGVMGQQVGAAAAGRVLFTGTERGYGETVIIDHGGGLSTLYAHASRILVEPEETVEAGDPVAEVGRSGNARGAHLHFEVRRNGHPVNPLPFLGGEAALTRSR